MRSIAIWESHPVQYKAPVYQELEKLWPGEFRVMYCTDCSVRGHFDREFGINVTWDVPLLTGYRYEVLRNERGVPLSHFRSLSGKGVYRAIRDKRPRAIIISQFLYEADIVALFSARLLQIPVAIRHETQDEALPRWGAKRLFRFLAYRLLYSFVDRAFYIGELNREHLIRHGFRKEQLMRSAYCARDVLEGISNDEKHKLRAARRRELGLSEEDYVVLFSGKLIRKKSPGLVLDAFRRMPASVQGRTRVLFMGEGELERDLQTSVSDLAGRVIFLGFVNQSHLVSNYLAADVLMLPSRRAGETWGLVVNEALHAGCGIVMSDAVGCHREFRTWERVRVIPEGDAQRGATALQELSTYERSFDWCAGGMAHYSVRSAALGLGRAFMENQHLS